MPPKRAMSDIFLSYTEKDREAVRRLADALQSVGWSVWWDRRIPAGLTWRSVLEHELQDMRCMVVLWSANSVQSEWVCEEAAEGRRLGRLVPVSIDRVRPPAGFREVQAADLVGWDGSPDFIGLQRLVEDIERLIGKPGAPPAAATVPGETQDRGDHAAVDAPPVDDDHPRAQDMPATGVARLPSSPGRRAMPWVAAALALLVSAGAWFGPWRSRPVDEPQRPDAAAATPPAPVATARPTPAAGPEPEPASGSPAPAAPATVSPPTTALLGGPAATRAAATPKRAPDKSGSKTTSVDPRCNALLERLQLGEQISSQSQTFLDQECRK